MTADQKPEPTEAMRKEAHEIAVCYAASVLISSCRYNIAQALAEQFAAGRRAGIEETPENVEKVEKVARAICGGECQWYDACQGDLGRSLEDRPCMKRARAAIRALTKEG